MGLFGKKPMYKYKPLERVRINIDTVNSKFLSSAPKLSSYEAKEYCELIGETEKYRIYIYQRKVSGSDGYFLRQEKAAPSKVAYLGSARRHCCVFHDKLFTIDSFSPTHRVYHPLICKDINTGVQTEIKILSDKGFREFVGTSMHLYCQDVVHSISIQNDAMVLEVYRYPADSILTRETYHEECVYSIHIKHDNGRFTATRKFPVAEEPAPPKPCWRDAQGKVFCPGDNCPNECDKTCPIWLKTMGLTMLKIKQFEKAIEAFSSALEMAPDFLDVQNNLGTAYGMNNQHQKAYEAFLAAHKMKPDYEKALHGLIVAETNLGLIEEATKHCDEYDRLPNCNSQNLRKALQKRAPVESATVDGEDRESFVSIAAEFLSVGRKDGYILSEGLTHIPELVAPCTDVCVRLIEEINEYGKEHPNARATNLMMAWCAFAGIGAVYHWHTNWNALSQKGIFETLTEERGVFAMDEYVLDLIGKSHDSAAGKDFTAHIMNMAECAVFRLATKGNLSFENILNTAKAMYLYGMVMEMNALGMY